MASDRQRRALDGRLVMAVANFTIFPVIPGRNANPEGREVEG
jgi:hypothetical protein